MRLLFLCLMAASLFAAEPISRIQAPPESFFELVEERDREKARGFYSKYIGVRGMPVVASGVVADEALLRTHEIVTAMLAGRADVVEALVRNRMYLIVIGKDQLYCDMPEYSRAANPAYLNERVRGTGGRPTSFGEENLLSLPLDRYDDESIAVHEFCHTIDSALRSIDSTWTARRNKTYQNAVAKGLWKNTYAASNPGEYWAEVAQSYFDCNRTNNWNHGPVGNREQLKAHDPEGYELARTIFNLPPEKDWRYTWAQRLPNVIAPPAKFGIDPYFTKFTYARELPVVGRAVSDEALLRANEVIRRAFAYRHDVLKALINDGRKLAIVEANEGAPSGKSVITAPPNDDAQLIRSVWKKAYELVANRAADPNWEKRGREVQQYELRVQRLDERFGAKVKELAKECDAAEFWANAVAQYFHPSEREKLKGARPDLFALVHEALAYEGRPDWRYRP